MRQTKDIEIAFTSIRNHKTVRCLNATAYGAYVAIMQAHLLDGIDPLPSDAGSIQTLGRLTGCQFGKCKTVLFNAITATLELLKKDFDSQDERNKIRHKAAVKGAVALHIKKHRERIARGETLNLSDKVSGAAPSQPMQAPKYRPQNYDKHAVLAAKSAALEARNAPKSDGLVD